MDSYILSCCSTADLSQDHFKQRNIHYICFHFSLNGKEYLDDLGQSLSSEELFRQMSDGADAKTSQVSIGEYEEYFEQFLQNGQDILHLTLSSGISGTYNSACIARDSLLERYPDRKIYIVDSLSASSGYGLMMDTLADFRDKGMSIDELHEWIESHKLKLNLWFFSTDLQFYIRGGRISKTAGFIGTVLNICPLLNVDENGKLIPREKIRTKKKVIKRIVEQMEAHVEELEYGKKCFLCHSLCLEDAKEVASLIEERIPRFKDHIEIFPIGATIGSHTGPGTVAVFFWGQERSETV